jgi:hypothetical protein
LTLPSRGPGNAFAEVDLVYLYLFSSNTSWDKQNPAVRQAGQAMAVVECFFHKKIMSLHV